ncbi:MAG: hypothetical protein J3Q66DRAFT_398763 [Benniella sp.]|nr:MAG: hypothetical protein J3Q66DRAFT_398763 [Benniella sp.]
MLEMRFKTTWNELEFSSLQEPKRTHHQEETRLRPTWDSNECRRNCQLICTSHLLNYSNKASMSGNKSSHGAETDAEEVQLGSDMLCTTGGQLDLGSGDERTTACGFKNQRLMTQQQLLVETKEEQQTFIRQHLEMRDKTQVHIEGLAKKNGDLIGHTGNLGLNESIMKHRDLWQRQQQYLKIKQDNGF